MKKLRELTAKEALFVKEYLLDLSPKRAAIRAGYSEHTAHAIGYELMRKEGVLERIEEAMKARSKRTEVTADKVIKELARIAFSDMDDFAVIEEGKLSLIDSNTRKRGRSRVIKKITQSTSDSSGPEGSSNSISQSLELHDKLRALELLGKHLKMFKDTLRVEGDLTLADLVAGSKDEGE